MPLKAILDSLEGVDAGMAAFYEPIEDDKSPAKGKFRLKVEPVAGFELDFTEGLKSTVQATRGERDQLKAQLAKFGDLDPTKAREALRRVDQLSNAEKDFDAKIRSVEEQLKARHSEEVSSVAAERDQLVREVTELRINTAAREALRKHKGVEELLLPHVTSQCRLAKTADGRFVVEVIDPASGQARIKNGFNDPMTIDDLVADMKSKEVFQRAFEPSGKSGAGASGAGSQSGAATNPWRRETRNLTEQSRITRENPELAKRLRAEAGAR